jgi:hypothetical protein
MLDVEGRYLLARRQKDLLANLRAARGPFLRLISGVDTAGGFL